MGLLMLPRASIPTNFEIIPLDEEIFVLLSLSSAKRQDQKKGQNQRELHGNL
jgi:hypothetical protein